MYIVLYIILCKQSSWNSITIWLQNIFHIADKTIGKLCDCLCQPSEHFDGIFSYCIDQNNFVYSL